MTFRASLFGLLLLPAFAQAAPVTRKEAAEAVLHSALVHAPPSGVASHAASTGALTHTVFG